MWSSEPVQRALAFATSAHEGQLVPGSDRPYVTHVMAVAAEVLVTLSTEPVDDPELALQAALLHDTVEDTDVTAADLEREFGPRVAAAVLALTKDPGMKKTEAMADSLRRIQQQPREVWRVKLADRIVNLEPPPSFWSKDKCRRYHAEAGVILTALGPACERLAARLAEQREAYREHFAE